MASDINIGNAQHSKGQLLGLVRDKDGNVKFDDWHNIHEGFHSILSEEDWDFIKEKQNGNHPRTNNS